MATLFDVSVPAINQHLKNIYDSGELIQEATIKKILMVHDEGGRKVYWPEDRLMKIVKSFKLHYIYEYQEALVKVQSNNYMSREFG